MARAKKRIAPGEGIASLLREAGQRAKQAAEQRQLDQAEEQEEVFDSDGVLIPDEIVPFKPRIFNVLEYIEQPWGLGMKLFPAQRFLVKLYYYLPLEDKEPTIELRDMFASKVLYHFTEKEYLHYLYNEGRCNIGEQDHERRELVLAIGRRAGKCIKGDTLVNTDLGLVEIGSLGDSKGQEYQPLQLKVSQEAGRQTASAYFYNGGERHTVCIRSRCGFEVEGTPNHRVKILGGDGCIQWKFLGDIQSGDVVGINRSSNLWASKMVFLGDLGVDIPKGNKSVSFPSFFDEVWATLLGVLVGDGTWVRTNSLEVTVGPYSEWLTQVQDIFRSSVGEATTVRSRQAYRVQFFSKPMRVFFARLGFKIDVNSDNKRIPWVVFRSPKKIVAAFLKGLFETDGSAERGGRIISFSTASGGLAKDAQLLLLNFGIVSRVKPRVNPKNKRTYYQLNLLGAESVRIFAEQIGFISDRKNSIFYTHLQKGDLGNKSGTESIPNQRLWCIRLLESVPKNNGNANCGKLGWRRSVLRAALGNVVKNSKENLTYPRLKIVLKVAHEVGADPSIISHFQNLMAANYFFDEVVSSTPGKAKVYDLTVPDGESFVANGFTNHNTTLSGVFASYEVYRLLNLQNPQEYYGLPNGNRIQIISVATDKDQASILFNEVTTHLAKCDYFKPFVANNTLSHITFRTPYDLEKYGPTARHQNGKFVSFNGKATMRVTFKSCVAKGLRGSGNVVVILDEMAHFQNKGQSSAKDIYDAVTPSTAAFSPKTLDEHGQLMPIKRRDGTTYPVESRIISISSPLNKSGKFFDLYHLAMTKGPGSENMLAIQAPTWEVNPTLPSSYYRQKYHSDPAVFMTEHGAQFSDRVRGWIEREADLVECLDMDWRPILMGIPRYPYQMGIDIGLIGDGTSVSITTEMQGKVVLAYQEYWQAGVDWRESNPHLGSNFSTEYCKTLGDIDRLDFDEISEWIYKLTKKFYITDGIFDRWNGIPLEQALIKKGLTQFKSEYFQRDLASRIYQNTKMLMFDKSLVLFDFPKPDGPKHSAFVEELLNLQAQTTSKNIVIVAAPQTAGAHDDRSDSYVRAVWLTSERMRTQAHVYGNSSGLPYSGGARMTPGRYQMMRARNHGGFSERTVPRNLGIRGRLAQVRMRTR